jgi:hypothetical protein
MTLARWQFNAHLEETLKIQQQMGASEKDTDDLRHMFTETEPVLLGVTMVVSLLHVLLDVLAFKSDISFWNNDKSTEGLAVKAMFTDFVSQVIVTAYLYEQNASLLVLVPSGFGIAIQLWKLWRAHSLGASDTTEMLDGAATNIMYVVLLPVVLGYAIYSLVQHKHTGFYGWGLESLASCVYAFGFAMMMPQIFINYKLKSVAHLPWKFFLYKWINTFIDDLFAFIIKMPTLHRLAVFRDDIVFFIYLYQRWIYPVDMERLNEFEQNQRPDVTKKDKKIDRELKTPSDTESKKDR